MTETLLFALVLIPCLVVAIVLHEVAHGWTALMLGDPTAQEQRRLTLNPLRHVDPVGTVLLPGALALSGAPVFGWAKPVPVNKWRLDSPRLGMMAVAAAGPGTNFLLAALGAIVMGLAAPFLPEPGGGEPGLAVTALFSFILINLFLGVFNLLPIPPFDGSHILEGLLPRSWARLYDRLRPLGMLFLFALIAVEWFAPQWGVFQNTVGVPVFWALEQYLGLAASIAEL